MLGKILIGAAAFVVISETVEIIYKAKSWRYWEKSLQEIPWPLQKK